MESVLCALPPSTMPHRDRRSSEERPADARESYAITKQKVRERLEKHKQLAEASASANSPADLVDDSGVNEDNLKVNGAEEATALLDTTNVIGPALQHQGGSGQGMLLPLHDNTSLHTLSCMNIVDMSDSSRIFQHGKFSASGITSIGLLRIRG